MCARPRRPTMRSRGQMTRQRSFERERRLESSNYAQDALIAITSGKVDASSERALLKFGATLFGAKAAESSSLTGFRYTAFEKAFGPSANAKNPLNKLKGVDASSLPPCEAELRQHIHRSAFVAKMWADADQQTIDQHPTTEDGWRLINDQYEIIWCNGLQLRIHWYPREKMSNVKMTIVLWYYRQTMNTENCLQRTTMMMQAMTIE